MPSPRQPKRQPRGEKRIAEIVAAASAIFAQNGFAGASMNAIAASVGLSMGSLYQYFPNKDAVVDAVAAEYLRAWRLHRETFVDTVRDASLEAIVRLGIENLTTFLTENAGVKTFLDADPARAASIRDIHEEVAFAAPLIAQFYPDAPPEAIRMTTLTATAMVRGTVAMIATELDEPIRRGLVPEIAVACYQYIIYRLGEPA